MLVSYMQMNGIFLLKGGTKPRAKATIFDTLKPPHGLRLVQPLLTQEIIH
jgi:hypothetical protein